MIKELLSKKNYNKLKLLSYFTESPNKEIDITTLSQFIDTSISTTTRYLKELKDDVDNSSSCNTTIMHSRSTFTFIYDRTENIQSFLEDIRNDYLNESSLFILCLCLCTHSKVSFHSLETTLMISRTNIYKLLSESNVVLAKYGLHINKNDYNYYQLEGNEINIRLFQCLFFMRCFSLDLQVFDTPSNYILQGVSSNIHFANFSTKYQRNLLIFHSIIFDRIHSAHYVQFDESTFTENISDSYLYKNTLVDYAYISSYTDDEQVIKAERFLYQLMLFTLFPNILPFDQIATIGKHISTDKNPCSIFCTEAIKQLGTFFDTDSKSELDYTHFSLFHMSIGATYNEHLSQFPFHEIDNLTGDSLSQKTFKPNTLTKTFNPERLLRIQKIIENTQSLTNYGYKSSDYCIKTLYNYSLLFSLNEQKPVNIYLDFNRNSLASNVIRRKLKAYFNIAVVNFVKDIAKADIQIVSNIISLQDDIDYIVISDSDDYAKFNQTVNHITAVYEKKNLVQ